MVKKSFLVAVLSGALFSLTACVETERPVDDELSSSGAPKAWQQTPGGFSGLTPPDN